MLTEFKERQLQAAVVHAKTSRHVGAQHETELVNRLPFAVEHAPRSERIEKLCRGDVTVHDGEMLKLMRTPVDPVARDKLV